jgi:hypothetical protein
MDFEDIENHFAQLNGPFGYAGMDITLKAMADYTNFCDRYFPKFINVVKAAQAFVEYKGAAGFAPWGELLRALEELKKT